MTASSRTYVYVSNGADGDIGSYRLRADGTLQPGARFRAAGAVGPLAISPDRRFLYAAVRSQPFSVHVYAIAPDTGALSARSVAPLAASCPYIALDRSGRFLFGASYHSHLISVNAVGADGQVAAEPLQVIPVGRNAHSIRADESNRSVYVPTLGSDQIFQFAFDPGSGRLAPCAPAAVQVQAGTGPRHFVTSADNRFLYVLSELLGSVSIFARDSESGALNEIGTVSGVPPGSGLVPGAPRLAPNPADTAPPRNRERDVWAADIHLRPDGRFLYTSERTGSTLSTFSVDADALRYLGSTTTELQPRGFAIAPDGRFLVACGERSEAVSVHAIDQESGALALLERYPGGKGANWVEIVSFDA
ncbi:MAG: beta-propeller fold lactonase family protein [Burkholderiales bacterium]|nr:beta-propeller fold lactonase family protein [Burkholderiales bacterium]